MTPWFVAVGASGAEGLTDIRALLQALPADLPAAVLIVLHRPWDRLSYLRQVLAQRSNLPIIIAANGEWFEAGVAYIGGPADHLTLAARSFGEIIDDPDRMHGNRTVDLLFKSVAAHGGHRMIGVVLSGSLDDGSRGIAAIHAAGGLTMVLTPSARPKPGMPENAIAYDGPIDVLAALRKLPKQSRKRCDADEFSTSHTNAQRVERTLTTRYFACRTNYLQQKAVI